MEQRVRAWVAHAAHADTWLLRRDLPGRVVRAARTTGPGGLTGPRPPCAARRAWERPGPVMMGRRRRKSAAASRPAPVLVPEDDGCRPSFSPVAPPALSRTTRSMVRRLFTNRTGRR